MSKFIESRFQNNELADKCRDFRYRQRTIYCAGRSTTGRRLLDTTAAGVKARKQKYGGDIFVRYSDEYGDRVQNWQRDERTGKTKGIIKINLRDWK